MSHILKGQSKGNMQISHMALFDEDTWHKRCSKDYFRGFRGGEPFWRVTHLKVDLLFVDPPGE